MHKHQFINLSAYPSLYHLPNNLKLSQHMYLYRTRYKNQVYKINKQIKEIISHSPTVLDCFLGILYLEHSAIRRKL